ncbi:MAG: trigger factor [Caldisericia bacterium]|nr:trigger factor [Caldisericia bacterium]
MNLSIKNSEKNKVLYEISFDKEEIQNEYKEVLNYYAKRVKVPGFRPGKAPLNLIKNIIGTETIFDEIKKRLRDKTIEKVFNDVKNLFPSVDVDFSNFNFDNPIFYLTTYLIPNVNNIDLNEIVRELRQVTDEEIENRITLIKEEAKEFIPKEGAIEKGDYVILKYKFVENEEEKEISLIVGENKNLLEEYVYGMNVGDKKDIEIQGKKIIIEIIEVKKPKYPELDENFFNDFEVSNLDEFKEKVKNTIIKERFNEEFIESFINKKLIEINDFYVPKTYIDDETTHRIEHLKEELLKSGISLEEFLKARNETIEDLRKNFDKSSQEQIKLDIILSLLSKDIEVSDDDIKFYFPDNYQYIIQDNEQKERVESYIKKLKFIKNLIEEIKKSGGADGI